jgi:hypothetical protein
MALDPAVVLGVRTPEMPSRAARMSQALSLASLLDEQRRRSMIQQIMAHASGGTNGDLVRRVSQVDWETGQRLADQQRQMEKDRLQMDKADAEIELTRATRAKTEAERDRAVRDRSLRYVELVEDEPTYQAFLAQLPEDERQHVVEYAPHYTPRAKQAISNLLKTPHEQTEESLHAWERQDRRAEHALDRQDRRAEHALDRQDRRAEQNFQREITTRREKAAAEAEARRALDETLRPFEEVILRSAKERNEPPIQTIRKLRLLRERVREHVRPSSAPPPPPAEGSRTPPVSYPGTRPR